MLEDASALKKANQFVPTLYQQRVVPFVFQRVAISYVYMWYPYCICTKAVCARDLFGVCICVAVAAGHARFYPFKLLRIRKEPGISPMSCALKLRYQEQCISVTSGISK